MIPTLARRGPLLFLAAIGVLIPVVALYRWLSTKPDATPAGVAVDGASVALSAGAQRTAGITVESVRALTRAERILAPGTLTLDEKRTARLGSVVEGIVLSAATEVGDRVRAGQALAQLHSPVVHEAWAAYRKGIAERRQRESELLVTRQARERADRLFADKAISRQEVQRAAADLVGAEQQLDMTRTEVRRAEEALEHYGVTNKEDPTGESGETIPVRSPLDGVVLEKSITQGTAVTPGTPLFVVSDLRQLWAVAEVDERLASVVRAGQPVSLTVAAYAGETFTGSIAFVADMVNPKTRRLTVRCTLPNADLRLKPEMYATITLATGEPKRVLAVPAAAVQEIDGKPLVFVAGKDGAFERRDVVVGSESEGLVEVRSGLREGERVAAAGSFLLKSELLRGTLAEEE
jgi:multidrug efflux pump subunit AcrA (membrane-fusion protein)